MTKSVLFANVAFDKLSVPAQAFVRKLYDIPEVVIVSYQAHVDDDWAQPSYLVNTPSRITGDVDIAPGAYEYKVSLLCPCCRAKIDMLV